MLLKAKARLEKEMRPWEESGPASLPSSSVRESYYLCSYSTFHLVFLEEPLWNKANHVNYPHPFSQCPLDQRIGALRVDIINACMWNQSPRCLRLIHSQKKIYISESKHLQLLAEKRVKSRVQESYQHTLRQFTALKSIIYHLPSFAVALSQQWPVGCPGLAAECAVSTELD